jgi:hypothetical protein
MFLLALLLYITMKLPTYYLCVHSSCFAAPLQHHAIHEHENRVTR